MIDMDLYRRFYRQQKTSFAGAGLRGIGASSIRLDHTGLPTALQLPKSMHTDMLHEWAVSWAVWSDSHFFMAVAAISLQRSAFDLELLPQS